MTWLLDTNIVSHAIRHPEGKVALRILRTGIDRVVTSIIVVAELRFGFARSDAIVLPRRLNTLLQSMKVHPLLAPADERYGEIRAYLERIGKLIGPNDLLIAAHALALDCTVVTDNEREFSRVPGLKVENWLR
jgi:tRNA(fMet)-specific endonuclease VapC